MRRSSTLALASVAVSALLLSCQRVQDSEELDPTGDPLLRVGIWRDSAEAAADSLVVSHFPDTPPTVGDTVWARVVGRGDVSGVRRLIVDPGTGIPDTFTLPWMGRLVWPDSGVHRVRVRVETSSGDYADSVDVQVTDEAPSVEVELSGDTLVATPGLSTTLPLSLSDDGRIDSVRWDLDGDGAWDTTLSPRDTLSATWSTEQALAQAQGCRIRVEAWDEDGNTGRDSFALVFAIAGPSLILSFPDTVSVGDTFQVAAQASSSLATSLAWSDGGTGATRTFVAPQGNDTVLVFQVIAVDAAGNSDTASGTVVVLRDAPVVTLPDSLTAHIGTPTSLAGLATQRFGTVTGWTWDLDGDGLFETSGDTVTATWDILGTRLVVVRAVDDDGNAGLDTVVVGVDDQAASLSWSVPETLLVEQTGALVALGEDPDGDSLEVLWVMAGDTLRGDSVAIGPFQAGSYPWLGIVRVRAPDGLLLEERSDSGEIRVMAPPTATEDSVYFGQGEVVCLVGETCWVSFDDLLANDSPGSEGSAENLAVVAALDGAVLYSGEGIGYTPSGSGIEVFRYVLSDGALLDTGNVVVNVSAATLAAGYLRPDEADTVLDIPASGSDTFALDLAGRLVVPENHEILSAVVSWGFEGTLTHPNLKTDGGLSSGTDLLPLVPDLSGFALEVYDIFPSDLEDTTVPLVYEVETHRTDDSGAYGATAGAKIVQNLLLHRYPTGQGDLYDEGSDTAYACEGVLEYARTFTTWGSGHAADYVYLDLEDNSAANDGKGYADGEIVARGSGVVDSGWVEHADGTRWYRVWLDPQQNSVTVLFQSTVSASAKTAWEIGAYNKSSGRESLETSGGSFTILDSCGD